MLNACFRNADIVSAENMFNQMPHRDVVSWTTMVNGFTKNKQYKKVMDFFGLMLGSNVRPNEATLVSVLSAMANLSCLDEGQACHGYVVRNHLNLSANMGTALIDMYAKCGCINEAMQVFSMVNVRERGICTWNAAIMALATHGLLDQALELYELMQKAKVRPNSVTFVGALSACARGGLVDKGLEIFGSMGQLHGVQPRMEHYGCMVNLLGRAGLMDRALELIKDMPFEPDCSVWGALLGACSVQGDVGLGEVIGLCAIEAQPMHCGRYVILSNIYATAGRWAEAAEMREMMAKRGIKKVVGWSRIWQVA
ncbi:putative pentatricopeptide repeat-containing protein At1g10330 [Amborella trichopoda]|nr:putative pentatricopeptide repeat-containing protein At1g10330 [Amborella trichopoda]|eukprot:XP_006840824.2 putative pentatricopeptide repeat-containing protein At1g10330 [Amborella trichopoda]